MAPLFIGMYYQSGSDAAQNSDEYLSMDQARNIALTYLEGGQVQSIELLQDEQSLRYSVLVGREAYLYGLYVDARIGEVSFFTPVIGSFESFPSIHIKTIGEDEPFVERTLWIDSEFILAGFDAVTSDVSLPGRIRGRGNSTWNMLPDKRPLRLRFETSQNFFHGELAITDWILLADHGDRSLLRNYSALYLARRLDGLTWTPAARSVHLYVNDEYMGVYLLTEERSLAFEHLDFISDPNPAVSDYFFEMEWRLALEGEEWVDFIRVNSHPNGVVGDASAAAGFDRDYLYEILYPQDEALTTEHLEYVQAFLTEVGVLIRQSAFEAVRERVDLDSLIDFYLVQELYKNMDVGFASVFLQIRGQGDERRLYHGPVWDFDIAAGNAYWMGVESQTPFGGLYVAERHYWYWYLMQMPEFVALLRERWNTVVHGEVLGMIGHLEHHAATHQSEFERNFGRHPILGSDMWPSPEHVNDILTFDGQVTYLTDFLAARASYLDDIFNGRRPMWE